MIETANAITIYGDDLAIDDCILHPEARQVFPQGFESKLATESCIRRSVCTPLPGIRRASVRKCSRDDRMAL
jgi:hypothetical protein